ncbi:hypothetical protein C7T87_16465 [Xanthomonas hortorum pv. hederae]|nr:hypothetical protein C7T87_16465 [Xanthomonas hortorum pv. hederae]
MPSLVSEGHAPKLDQSTRRESIPGGSVAASMSPHGPAPARDTAPPVLLPLIGRRCSPRKH